MNDFGTATAPFERDSATVRPYWAASTQPRSMECMYESYLDGHDEKSMHMVSGQFSGPPFLIPYYGQMAHQQ